MTFPKDTIRLGAAQEIFAGATIAEILIGGKVAGYKISYRGVEIEDKSLTVACKRLWVEGRYRA